LRDSLTGASTTFAVILKTERTDDAGELTDPAFNRITANHVDISGSPDDQISPEVDDDADCLVAQCRLLIQINPQTYGHGSGISGNPGAQNAGVQFSATVRAVDGNFNQIENGANSDPEVSFEILEGTGLAAETNPANLQLVNGQGLRGDFDLKVATNVTRIKADNVAGYDFLEATSLPLTVNTSDYFRLHALLPGESLKPGQTPFDGTGGRSGSPAAQIAGNPFNVGVYSTDRYYNRVSTTTSIVLETADIYDEAVYGPQSLSGGFVNIPVTLKTSTETAPNPNLAYARCNDPAICAAFNIAFGTSSHIPVNSSAPVAFSLIVPNESFEPGCSTCSGKTGSAVTDIVVGSSLTLTVRYIDAFYNKVPNPSPVPRVKIVSDDIFANHNMEVNLTTGAYAFNTFYFREANASPGWRIYATTAASSAVSNVAWSTSPYLTAGATTTARLLVILPDETYDPGNESGAGKYGSASNPVAGSTYTITVRAVDRFYNQRSTDTAVFAETTDPYDIHPSTVNLESGTTTFNLIFRTATQDPDIPRGPWAIRAATATSSNMASSSASNIVVSAGAAVKLLVLPSGTSHEPGSSSGFVQPASTQTAGTPFGVTVKVVDVYNNRKDNAPAEIRLASNDPHDELKNFPSILTTTGSVTFANAVLRTVNRKSDATPAGSPDGWLITASTAAGVYYADSVSTAVPVVGGPADRLMALMPGEALDEGNTVTGGKSAANPPWQLRAGSTYTVTVYATDNSYNIDITTNAWLSLNFDPAGWAYDDQYATAPVSSRPLLGGATNFDISFKIGESTTTGGFKDSRVVVFSTGNALSQVESSSVSVMFAAEGALKLQIVGPNETAWPGKPPYDTGLSGGGNGLSAGGKLQNPPGNPPDVIAVVNAGDAFGATLRAVDRYWNKVATHTVNVRMTSQDPVDTPDPKNFDFTGSSASFWTFQRAKNTGWKLSAMDNSSILLVATSPAISVPSGAARRFQILLPGESWSEDSATGKIGAPYAWTAGVSSRVTVNAVDDYWNIASDNSIAKLTADDLYAQSIPDDADGFPNTLTHTLQTGTTYYDFIL
ncbi:MAG: hypothetical protein HY747_10625, partial [Elusimicrobia bacterium]|nr:hypothetical protein [Elusimicrobiota bacterium]